MSGFGGAGAFSDGKYNITNDFGGTLYEYVGKKQALELIVDKGYQARKRWTNFEQVTQEASLIREKLEAERM